MATQECWRSPHVNFTLISSNVRCGSLGEQVNIKVADHTPKVSNTIPLGRLRHPHMYKHTCSSCIYFLDAVPSVLRQQLPKHVL
jgi:hypothetical protein